MLPIIIILVVGVLILFTVFVIIFGRSKKDGKKEKKKKTLNKDRGSILKEANRRLAQNPKDPEALQALADLYYGEGDWDKAMKTYNILIDLCATNPDIDEYEATLRFGLSAMKLKKYEDAYKSLMIAKTMRQDVFEINHNLGYLEFKRKNYERAFSLLNAARSLKPENTETQKYLGHTQYRLKKYKDAIAVLRRVVDVHPEDKESLFTMGQCYNEMGMNDQALKIFTHLRPDPVMGPNAALIAGTIHANNRNYEKAEMDFEIGLRHKAIKPEVMLELKYRLAAVYTKQQNLGKAIPLLQEIYEVNPKYKDVGAQLSRNKELNSNRNLQIFLIAPDSEFVTLCRKIVNNFFPKSKSKITDINVRKSEYADLLAEVETTEWEDIVLYRFIRTTGQVGELLLRDFHSRIKECKAGRGFCIAAGSFTDGAQMFVEARLIDLIDKGNLVKILNKL